MINNAAQHLQSVLEHPYQSDVCFLCATALTNDNRTAEHVIPRWMQDRYNLGRRELTLLNKTTIRYEQLKIPCCFTCNNHLLSPLENRIATATTDGYEATTKISRFDLFQWTAKIYLGIVYKELSLFADRSDRSLGTILSPDSVRSFAILHFWLQMQSSSNDPNYTPGSLWIFRCQASLEVSEQFDLKDDPSNGVIAIRMGQVAVVADFLDNGVHQQINAKKTSEIAEIALHPIQFSELTALIIYEASLLSQESVVEFFEHDGQLSYSIRWWSTVDGPSVLEPWDRSNYAKTLSFYTGVPYETIYQPPDGLMSWLHDSEGNIVYWPLHQPHPSAQALPSSEK